MANLRDIRIRIKSVKNTAQITRAMQLVATSKMKRAQDASRAGSPYAALLARILAPVANLVSDFSHPFLDEREIKNRCIIIVSTDKGLCGGLNGNMFRELPPVSEKIKYITVGRKASQYISRTARDLIADFSVSDKTTFPEIRKVIEYAIAAYKEGKIDSIEVMYPRFINTLKQAPTLIPLLPLTSIQEVLGKLGVEEISEDDRELKFEPSVEEILNELLPLFVKHEFYAMVVAGKASEHSARMVAMKSATDNANSIVDSLTLDYNKARQAAITQEILEIAAATSN